MKIKVYEMEHLGETLIDRNLESIMTILIEASINEKYTISIYEMTEAEYKKLPEFQGF